MKSFKIFVFSLLSTMLLTGCEEFEGILDGLLEDVNNESTKIANLYYVKNETKDMDMITDNVNHMLFIGTDTETKEKTIKGARLDTISYKSIDYPFVVYMDSLNRVSSILLENLMCKFYNYTETSCDIVFINGDGTYYSVENIALSRDKFEPNKTRSTSGEDFLDDATKVIGGFKASAELALSICKNPDKIRTLLDTFDYLSEMMPGGWKFGTSSTTMGINAKMYNLKPDLFSLCMYLIETGRTLSESLKEQLIGNWELELISVEQIDVKNAEIVFTISGIKENPSVELYGYVWYMNKDSRHANNISFNVENNTYTMLLPIESYGSFFGRVYLLGDFGFGKNESFEFSAYHLELSKYEIEDSPLYENGAVNFNISVFLKGKEDGLKGIQQFGYYVKYANAIDYNEVKNLSSIFESTPLTYELSIPRDGFSDETTNYTTFEAKPSIDYYIGVYVVLKNGNIVHFDEKPIEGLVYDTKPSVKYLESNITGTEITSTEVDEEGEQIIHYKTMFQNKVSILGSFWIEYLEWQCEGEGWEKISGDNWYIEKDGVYITTHFSTYTNRVNLTHNVYFIVHLTNGSSRRCDNYLTESGSETITNVSIVGTRASVPPRYNTKHMQVLKSNVINFVNNK